MYKEVNLTLQQILDFNGVLIEVYEKRGIIKTTSKLFNKMVKNFDIECKGGDKFVYLVYEEAREIQAIYKIQENKENLIQVYRAF